MNSLRYLPVFDFGESLSKLVIRIKSSYYVVVSKIRELKEYKIHENRNGLKKG